MLLTLPAAAMAMDADELRATAVSKIARFLAMAGAAICGQPRLRRLAARQISEGPVIDAATGNGASVRLLRSQGLFAIATDIDSAKLQAVKPAVACDMRAMPFRASSAAGVLMSFCLHHIHGAEDRRRALAEAARILRPGGVIVVCDWRENPPFHPDWPMPQPDEVEAALRDGGLEIAESEPHGPMFLIVARQPEGT